MTENIVAEKRCHDCKAPARPGKSRCAKHGATDVAYSYRRYQAKLQTGTCMCGEPLSPHSTTRCDWCIIRNIARCTAGGSKNAQAIADILKRQDYKCAYTGETMELGLNASLDHKTPTARGGSVDDPANLQWVSNRINRMKTDFTHDEFLAMCRHIAERQQTPCYGV